MTTVLAKNLTGTIAQPSNKLAGAIDSHGFDQMLADSIRAVTDNPSLLSVSLTVATMQVTSYCGT